MLYIPQAKGSHQVTRWAWVKSPIQSLDNPVKRYLGNRAVGPGLWKRPVRWVWTLETLRPAF